VPAVVAAVLGALLAALFILRFLGTGRRMCAAILLFPLLVAGEGSMSWRELGVEWLVGLLVAVGVYLAVVRVIRWNLVAWTVWLWAGSNEGALETLWRFRGGAHPDLLEPALIRAAVFALPLLALGVAAVRRSRWGRQEGPEGGR
jgi:hypothetical protein